MKNSKLSKVTLFLSIHLLFADIRIDKTQNLNCGSERKIQFKKRIKNKFFVQSFYTLGFFVHFFDLLVFLLNAKPTHFWCKKWVINLVIIEW